MKKIALIVSVVAAVVVLSVGAWLGYRFWQASVEAEKYKSAKEIDSASITKKGSTWTIRIESVIDKPADAVWKAFREPERSEKLLPETWKRSRLVAESPNEKKLDLEVQLLFLPSMTMDAAMTFDDVARRGTIRTAKGMQDIDGVYEVEAITPERTLFRFSGTAVDKISLPLPQSVVEGALRELFVVQVRTIQTAISGARQTTEAKEEFAADAPKRCAGPPPPDATRQVTMTVARAEAERPSGPPEFRNDTPGGSERGYVIDGIPVREAYGVETRCATATAWTGNFVVQVQSILISPAGLEEWVRQVDLKSLAALPPEADRETLLRAFPRRELPRGWQIVPANQAPTLAAPLAHQVYEQATF